MDGILYLSTMNMDYKENSEPLDIELFPTDTYLSSIDKNTATDDSSDVENDAVSYRCIFTTSPIIEGLYRMYQMNHMLPSVSQRAEVFSVIIKMSLTAAIAVSLATGWRLILERRDEASQSYKYTVAVGLMSTLPKHIKPEPVCILTRMSIFVFFSLCVIRLFYSSVFPKPIHFKCSFVPKTVLLVLYLGAHPTSALPTEQLSPSVSIRQSNTVWTVQLRGWPNTGYCTMMQFGTNKQQMVRCTCNC